MGTMSLAGPPAHVGAYDLQLTDKVEVNGSVIATGAYFGALNLGDNSVVHGMCVTGGGGIDLEPKHPPKCKAGTDISGNDPLVTATSNAMVDAATFSSDLGALPPTIVTAQIDTASGTDVL